MELKRLTEILLKVIIYGFVTANILIGLLLLFSTVPYLIPFIVVCTLIVFAIGYLIREARDNSSPAGKINETIYGFAGHDLRVFSNGENQVWLRANDVRNLLGLDRSDERMALIYPEGFRKANPKVRSWYIRTDTIQRHWQGSTKGEINRFLHWMERELIPLQLKLNGTNRFNAELVRLEGASYTGLDLPSNKKLFFRPYRYFRDHWQGKHGLVHTFFAGGGVALLIGIALNAVPLPEDFIEHYRIYSFLALVIIIGYIPLLIWWGVGVWRSTRQWLAEERSLLLGALLSAVGMMTVLFALGNLADRDRHFTALSYAIFAADLDEKPRLSISPDGERLVLVGEMGIGTTRTVRDFLERHSKIDGVELNSPGGRAHEGLALGRLIQNRNINTYVRDVCASACVLAFVGGKQRLAAPASHFGLHRSGVSWRRSDNGLSEIDRKMKQHLIERGVTADFVAQGLMPELHEIWNPPLHEVIKSNLATDIWRLEQGGSK